MSPRSRPPAGDHTGAEDEFRETPPFLRRRLGPEHPDTLAARFSIAREMAARGDHAGAEDEFRDVLPHLERKLGPDHPATLVLWFSIAREMAARGDHAGRRPSSGICCPTCSASWGQTTRTRRRPLSGSTIYKVKRTAGFLSRALEGSGTVRIARPARPAHLLPAPG